MPWVSNNEQRERPVNKNKKKTKKNRRGKKGRFNVESKFSVVGANCNGISSKKDSLDHIITALSPSVITLQETRQRKEGRIKTKNSDNYIVFELVRKNSQGGGLATLVRKELNPVFVSEGNDLEEIIVVECNIQNIAIRVVNCYGPQENSDPEKKQLFWSRLKNEVTNALDDNCEVIIQCDGNLHCGGDIIKGDPHPINRNGKLFSNFLEEHPSMVLLNASSKCQGLITRARMKENILEESIIDFMLVSQNLEPFVKSMVIDQHRSYPLCSHLKKGKSVLSDHFTQILQCDIKYMKQKPVREEYFDFKSPEGLAIFQHILDTEPIIVLMLHMIIKLP